MKKLIIPIVLIVTFLISFTTTKFIFVPDTEAIERIISNITTSSNVSNVKAVDQKDIDKITKFMMSDKVYKFFPNNFRKITDKDGNAVMTIQLKEDLGKIKDYRCDMHRINLVYNTHNNGINNLSIVVKEIQECLSPDSYTFVEWIIFDYSADQIVDYCSKDFIIVMENYQGEKGYNVRIIPVYPDGYKNIKWYVPTKEEIQRYYNKELKYWIKKISSKK